MITERDSRIHCVHGSCQTHRGPLDLVSPESLEKLLDAAEDQLREEELEFFTVDRVLERAGASVGSFYRRFPSRHQLLCATFDRFKSRIQPALLEALKAEQQVHESLDEAVDHAFGILIEHVLRERQLARAFMLLAAFDSVIRERVKELNIERRNAVFELLVLHKAEIPHPDPDVAIHQAYHIYLSCIQGRLVFFAPNNIPHIGISDEFIFAQLKVAITNFLRRTADNESESTQ